MSPNFLNSSISAAEIFGLVPQFIEPRFNSACWHFHPAGIEFGVVFQPAQAEITAADNPRASYIRSGLISKM